MKLLDVKQKEVAYQIGDARLENGKLILGAQSFILFKTAE